MLLKEKEERRERVEEEGKEFWRGQNAGARQAQGLFEADCGITKQLSAEEKHRRQN